MTDKPDVERNIERLVEAAFNRDARLAASSRDATYRLLLADLRSRRGVEAFPERLLVLLTVIVVLLTAWLVARLGLGDFTASASPVLPLAAALVVINVAVVPVAALVVVIGRKHVEA
jgi:hypothetical protein